MKTNILVAVFALVFATNAKAINTNKPISSQYGFIENKGQIIDQNNNPNPSVLYLYNGNGLHVQLRKEGFSYEVIKTVKTLKSIIDKGPQGKFISQSDSFDITYQTHRVDINFKDGNKNTTLKPTQPASDFINYYTTGTSEEGVTNVHHFKKIVYENVYPNIDIEFVLNDAANFGKFKYNFIVKPNANLADIKLEFLGANRTSLNQEGNIIIETAYGNIEETIPLSYVINNNNSHSTIKANFIALANNIFGVNAENYNHNQTLVIDPTNWATYYGGSSYDTGYEITTDDSCNIEITGYTYSISAIASVGSYQITYGGSIDAYITKFNSNGVRQWATYYGGNSEENGNGITTDLSGNIIIVGYTYSTNGIATTGSYQAFNAGSYEAFLAKFNANGIRQWATYYGGSNAEYGEDIATDASDNIVITGNTASTSLIATSGAHNTTYGGGSYDAFIVKFNSSGVRQWGTYYGGTNEDIGNGITADSLGNILITGYTLSSNSISSGTTHQASLGGSSDAFIVKFNTNGIRQWGTYYGGSNDDKGLGITTDGNNILVTGYSSSTNAIATTGSHQTINSGNQDAFITKFNSSGVRQWGSYYGGSGQERGYGVTTDIGGNIIIIGTTSSSTAIATLGVYQTTIGGINNAFIAKFNTSGIRQWASYFGGNGSADGGSGITADTFGNIIITGSTSSTSSIASTGSHQTIFGGNTDAFIAKFNPNGTLPVKLISFIATLAIEKVNCTWETATETNNDYFTIERSKDGNGFESFGNVKGQGNSNINTHYSFTDNNPFGGISYYRLKQTDFDGKYTYSTIREVGNTEELASKISLYYENNTPIIKINSLVENNAIIEIINLNGTKLLSNEQPIISGENTFAVKGNITGGLYLLKVQMENEMKFFKVWVR